MNSEFRVALGCIATVLIISGVIGLINSLPGAEKTSKTGKVGQGIMSAFVIASGGIHILTASYKKE